MLVILKKRPQRLPGSGEVDLLRERGARTRLQTLEAGRQQAEAALAELSPGPREPLPARCVPAVALS